MARKFLTICGLLFLSTCGCQNYDEPERRLLSDLLAGYERLQRPAQHDEKVVVFQHVHLVDVVALDENNSHMTVHLWSAMRWTDERLTWDPAQYDGMKNIYLLPKRIWTPDITVLNSVHTESSDDLMLTINNDGVLKWYQPLTVQITCRLRFRTDSWLCPFKFGSWVYNSRALDLRVNRGSPIEMDTSSFEPNDHWDVLSQSGTRELKSYTCCPQYRYYSIEYIVSFRKKIGASLLGRRRRRRRSLIK